MSKTLIARLAAVLAVTALALAFGPLGAGQATTVKAAPVTVVVSDDPGAGGCC
ncbi:hypothetical protein ACFV4P_04995 [Kitasatospora sp. NPDC059795]|uniref:hypothetical protein n=1 Tax=Kitasatospora sp. NPDC059795 TaxID=3346949 RepID=UPI00364D265B